MPTYDYRCQECSYEFEFIQSMLDTPLKECPQCNGEVKRLISKNITISFKGSGFYVNDSKSKNPTSTTVKSNDASNKATTDKPTETKADAVKKEPATVSKN